MPPSLDLHIGTHKTGSTAVQFACTTFHDRLLEHGVLYPDAGRGRFFGHHSLQFGLRGARGQSPSDAEAHWQALASEVARHDPEHVVLSSEGFESMKPETVRIVARLVRDITNGPVRIVLYLRPYYAYLRSAYKQQLQGGTAAVPFEAFAARKIKKSAPGRLAARWAEVFGEDALVIRLYEEARQAPGGLVADFLGLVTAPAAREVPYEGWLHELVRENNPSISDEVAVVLARANPWLNRLHRLGLNPRRRRRARDRIVQAAKGVQRRWPEPFASVTGPLIPLSSHDAIRKAIRDTEFDLLAPWLSPDEIGALQRIG